MGKQRGRVSLEWVNQEFYFRHIEIKHLLLKLSFVYAHTLWLIPGRSLSYGLVCTLLVNHQGLKRRGGLEDLITHFLPQPHNDCSPTAPWGPKYPFPMSPFGQEDGLDPGSDSWPLLGNWLPATSSPCVSPFPLNASQLPRWCPDNPHPLPGVWSSFRGSAQLLESFSAGRIMSPSVITHLPGNWGGQRARPAGRVHLYLFAQAQLCWLIYGETQPGSLQKTQESLVWAFCPTHPLLIITHVPFIIPDLAQWPPHLGRFLNSQAHLVSLSPPIL